MLCQNQPGLFESGTLPTWTHNATRRRRLDANLCAEPREPDIRTTDLVGSRFHYYAFKADVH